MRITFSPAWNDTALTLEKTSGDRLRINGELLNFNGLNDGDVIPYEHASAHLHDWLVGPIEKVDGEVRLTVLLPHGSSPEPWQLEPEPIVVTEDGTVDVPTNTTVEVEHVDVDGGTNVVTTTRRWRQESEVSTEFVPAAREAEDEDA
ncbi:hypothetical protein [Aliihoeflea sp. PC F10.4]